jgi:hypothetical protein
VYLSVSLVSEIILTGSISKAFGADQEIIIHIYSSHVL